MATLTITKSYSTGQALMEAHVDNFRTGLHTLFNVTKFDASNFAGTTISSSKFIGNTLIDGNGEYIDFGATPDAQMGLDSSGNFHVDTAADTTTIEFLSDVESFIISDTEITLPGDIVIKAGNSGHSLLQAFSSYKKPVLEYASPTAISVQNNAPDDAETLIYFPNFVCKVNEITSVSSKFRRADITNTARGYQGSSTGSARGGRRDGLSLTSNSWYAVYAAKVRSGDDYDPITAKFVLVYDTTLPTGSNEATLDSRYGEGNWVYLGLIRYGFGATGSSSSIPKFKQSNKGWTYFYETDSTGYGGLNLAYSTSSSSNDPLYTLSTGMNGNVVPEICGALQFNVARQDVSDWWIEDASGDTIWQGGWQNDVSTLPHGFQVEMPNTTISFHHTVKGTGSVAKAVVLTGFCDTYHTLRRQGTGI